MHCSACVIFNGIAAALVAGYLAGSAGFCTGRLEVLFDPRVAPPAKLNLFANWAIKCQPWREAAAWRRRAVIASG